jgi:hypothetical protein
MIHSGCGDLALLGRPALDARSRRENAEFIGTVEEVDHSRGELYLRTQGGQSQVVTYTNRTRVIIDGKETPAGKIERGDIIEVRMHGSADGRAMADSIRVHERGRVGTSAIEGMVERVLSERKVIELRSSAGALITVYLPQNSPDIAQDEFSRLRSGDFVRFQGSFLGGNRFESVGILTHSDWRRRIIMQFYISLQPLMALIAGILILLIPRLLNYVVALYLIITGILGLTRM